MSLCLYRDFKLSVPEEITIVALALRLIKFWICQMCDHTLEDSKRRDEKETH